MQADAHYMRTIGLYDVGGMEQARKLTGISRRVHRTRDPVEVTPKKRTLGNIPTGEVSPYSWTYGIPRMK